MMKQLINGAICSLICIGVGLITFILLGSILSIFKYGEGWAAILMSVVPPAIGGLVAERFIKSKSAIYVFTVLVILIPYVIIFAFNTSRVMGPNLLDYIFFALIPIISILTLVYIYSKR